MSYTHEELVNSLGSIRVRDMRTLTGFARNREGCADGLIQFLQTRLPEEQFNSVAWDGDKAVAVIRDWLVQNSVIEALDTEDMTTDEQCSHLLEAARKSFTRLWRNENGIDSLAQSLSSSLQGATSLTAFEEVARLLGYETTNSLIQTLGQFANRSTTLNVGGIPITNETMQRLLNAADFLKVSGLSPSLFGAMAMNPQMLSTLNSISNSLALHPPVGYSSHLIDMMRDLGTFTDITRMVQTSLTAFDTFRSVANRVPLLTTIGDIVQPALEAYSDYYNAGGFSSKLLLPATNELFTLADITASLALQLDGDVEQGDYDELYNRTELRNHVAPNISQELDAILARESPMMLRMLQGARHSLESGNPDRSRHFCTSARELILMLLDSLASDSDVEHYFPDKNDPSNYDNGKLTKSAKLRYICRDLNQPALQEYVEEQIGATVKLIKELNKGTHNRKAFYDDTILYLLLNKVESSLWFVFEVSISSSQ